MKGKPPPNPPLEKGGEIRNPEAGPQGLLAEALAWLDYCLRETSTAMAAVKEATLAAMRRGEPISLEQLVSMYAAEAGLITLRGRAARGFRASCPYSESRRDDESD